MTSLNLHRRPAHVTLDTTVNIIEMNGIRDYIKCYPNPAHQYTTINVPYEYENAGVNIFDLNGRLIRSESRLQVYNSNLIIRLDEIPEGLYLIQVVICKEQYYSNIIKNNRGTDW